MAIRLPLYGVGNFTEANEVGVGSVAGGIAHTFTIPQDTDNVVVKFTASVAGGGASATFQTTDDGGVTWYDIARTSVVSNANNTTAEWLSVPVISPGIGQLFAGAGTSSVVGATPGSAAASTLGSRQYSGLPVLSPTARVFIRLTGNITSAAANSITTKVSANSQSATA